MLKKIVKPTVICFSFLAIILFLYFGSLFFPEPSIFFTPEFQRSDVWHLNYPLKDYLGGSLKSGRVPLWNSKVGTGFPFLAEGQIGTFNLANMVLFGLLSSWLAFNLSYVLIFVTAFSGSFLLFSKNKISVFSSFVGAFVFAFSSFFITHINHFAMIQAASFLPWVIYAAQNFWKNANRRNLVLFILFLSQMFFSGHFQIFFVTLIGLFIFFISVHHQKSPNFVLRKSIIFVLSLIFTLGIVGIQLIPTLELFASSIRTSLISFSDITAFKSFKQLLTLINPYYFGTPADGSFPSEFPHPVGLFWESNFYIGIMPILLMVMGIFKKKKTIWERSNIALIIISLILSFGQNSPLGFIFFFPLISSMRGAGRFILLTILGMSGLVAIGFDGLRKYLYTKSIRLGKIAALIIPVIIFIELHNYGSNLYPTAYVKNILEAPGTTKLIPKGSRVYTDYSHYQTYFDNFVNKGWIDIKPFLYFRNALDEDSNILYGIGQINVYSAIPIIRQYVFLSSKTEDTLDISAVDYFITTKELEGARNFTLVGEADPPKNDLPEYFVYKNENVLDRFRFVSSYSNKKFDIKNPALNFDVKDSVILEKDISEKFSPLNTSKIEVLRDEDQKIVLRTETDSNGILVMADTYYPGWKAKINGKRANILPANINQRAIIVPPGENTIEIYYQPLSFAFGFLISTVSLLFLIFGKKYLNAVGIIS